MGLLPHALDGRLLAADRRLLTKDRGLLTPDRALLAGEELEDQPVSAPHHLRVPLSDFLLDANRVAGVVSRNAQRLSAASRGRISAHTADEMQGLVEEILRIGRERERELVGPIRPLVRRAEHLVAEIGAAAKVVAVEKPIVAEQIGRIRSGGRQRSAFAAAWSLEMHLGLVRANEEFAAALGPGFVGRATEVLTAMAAHRDAQRSSADASVRLTRERDKLVARLQAMVRDVRVVEAVLEGTHVKLGRANDDADVV